VAILAINCGSSTLKLLLADGFADNAGSITTVARGLVDAIGPSSALRLETNGDVEERPVAAGDHDQALEAAIASLRTRGLVDSIEAIGHRVVHGGPGFRDSTLLTDDALAAIEAATELAPLHNAPALEAIGSCRRIFGDGLPMVASFDTAFHRTLPERASLYAVDPDLARRHGVYRYGFHGLAHRSMLARYEELSTRAAEESRLITLQLGAGCSVAAIDLGRSIDTSMGFTPLEGLVMASRSGDIDPSVVQYVARREGVAATDILDRLNHQSGLLGLSGISSDMRDLLAAERRGDERAALAVDMFCYRARKYIGAYLAALGGADAIVFGGGIGEHSPEIRSRICSGLEWAGLVLDNSRNAALEPGEGLISSDTSQMAVYVAAVDEESIIVRDTLAVLSRSREP
jgi:acetate kinase